MGCPTSGSVVFVYPIQSQLPPHGIVKGLDEPNGNRVQCFSVYNSKELYLEQALSWNRSTIRSNMLSSFNFPAEKSHNTLEIGMVSSPKTPLYQSKFSSSSPSHSTSSICEDPVSHLPNPNSSYNDSFDIRDVMGDESAKKLLQTCATTWLYSCKLLCGNFVSIPILSEVYIFRVVGAKDLSAKSSSHDLTKEKVHDLPPDSPDLANHAFVINRDTKVCLYSPSTAVSETSVSGVELEYKDVKARVVEIFLKLGGLSKEYAILKDMIISSSVKDTILSLRTTKGVLLHGPPGTGKTTLAQLCARDAGVELFCVNAPEIVSQFYGENEKALHEVFESACQAAPAVVRFLYSKMSNSLSILLFCG